MVLPPSLILALMEAIQRSHLLVVPTACCQHMEDVHKVEMLSKAASQVQA
jgi:hypothetical protein